MGRVRELEGTMSRINKDCALSLSHEMGCPLLDETEQRKILVEDLLERLDKKDHQIERQRQVIEEMKEALNYFYGNQCECPRSIPVGGCDICPVVKSLAAAEELEDEK
jgi:hypothetical protein